MRVTVRIAFLGIALAIASVSPAQTFRWTSQADANWLDPHVSPDVMGRTLARLPYEALIGRDKDFNLVPALAVAWENPAPTRWILHLRKGVRFHDGSPFSANDVVFSINRAKSADSPTRVWAAQAGTPSRIDDLTVELITPRPNPVMLESLSAVLIMSKAWSEKHGVTRPLDWKRNEESYAVRHAMGTGPFVLVSREPGVLTVYRKNAEWWGIGAGRFDGNVQVVEHRPIESPATRYAALKSGQVDFVLDPAPQDVASLREDPGVRVWEGAEQRVVYVGLDLDRNELLYSNVTGRNPFKDLRVRVALYQAIDIEALHRQVMHGASIPTGIALHDPAGTGVSPELERRPAFDPEGAKRLLREAGYPQGFAFTFACTNDRMLNDDKICAALAAMWARVGLDVKTETMPRAVFLKKAYARDLSAFLYSYGAAQSDAIFMLKTVLHGARDGQLTPMNYGNVRDQRLDSLIDAIEVEMDAPHRHRLIDEAVGVLQAELPIIPLHRQVIAWASRANVSLVHSREGVVNPVWVRIR